MRDHRSALADFNTGEFYNYMCEICPFMRCDQLHRKSGVYRGKEAKQDSGPMIA